MRFALVALSIVVVALATMLFGRANPATATMPFVVTLSHFDCYSPVPQGAPPPPPRNVVALKDQFQNFVTQVGPAVLLCNPVMKQLQPGVAPLPVPTPADHLECYAIVGPQVHHTVTASNQLQRQNLMLGMPRLLCVPTNKKLLR